jgi:phosphatidate cytidylyltransferase
MVLPRILTSVFFVPIVLAVAWYGSIPFFLFVLGVCLMCAWEYTMISEQGGYPNQKFLVIAGSALLIGVFFVNGAALGPLQTAPGATLALCALAFLAFTREFFRADQSHSFLRVITSIGGLLLCGFFLGHLLLIRDLRLSAGEGFEPVGRRMTFFLITLIWTVDTGAWAVGRMIGRHSLSKISPKKTWEGTLGGTALAFLVAWIFRDAFLVNACSRQEIFIYTAVIAVSAQASDLIESMIKRSFGVKDSSELLPGHGGFLDRFDSFIFAAPLFYYALLLTGRFQ